MRLDFTSRMITSHSMPSKLDSTQMQLSDLTDATPSSPLMVGVKSNSLREWLQTMHHLYQLHTQLTAD